MDIIMLCLALGMVSISSLLFEQSVYHSLFFFLLLLFYFSFLVSSLYYSLVLIRRSSRALPSAYRRDYLLGDDFRLVDAGDWGSEIPTGRSPTSSLFTDITSQRERFQLFQETNKKPPGLTQEALDSLPLEVFSSREVAVERKLSRESRDCSICLDSFRDEDVLTRLPCGHRFHLACLDPWVRTCGDCPYCRRSIV
ncbi:hypothetical protein PTKIN_Ptkin10aG0123900 [Pterospermum kingtungense]